MDTETTYLQTCYGLASDTPCPAWRFTFSDGRTMEADATHREIAQMVQDDPGMTWERIK